MTRDLSSAREEYARGGLDVGDLSAQQRADPVLAFEQWYDEAREAGIHEPNAMVLSTASAGGRPSSRTVLLKEVSERGFVFYTNHGSRKGGELGANPWAALLFGWHDLERQVRVEGAVEVLDRDTVAAYFASRPRGSQLGAWASHQSSEVGSRDELAAAYAEVEARFEGVDVPVPDFWGGYAVRPEVVELWQGRPSRMHDRLVWRRDGNGDGDGGGWTVTRLAP